MKRFLTIAPALAILVLSPKFVGILGAIVLIGGLIFVHELGHFLAAKRMGMPVEVFSLGFGTRLLGFKWKETDVRLSALPLGGYVKLAGYNPEEPDAEDPHGFLKQPYRKRMLFYAGGVLANVLTTFVLLTVLGAQESRLKPAPFHVAVLFSGDRAEQGGLKLNDQIEAIGDLKFPGATWTQAVEYIQAHPDQVITFKVLRAGQPLSLDIKPRNENGKGKLGLLAQNVAQEPFRFRNLGNGLLFGAAESCRMAGQVLKGFGRLFTFRTSVKELGGPITIVKIGYEAAKAGWAYYLYFCAFISINLAILNALPIPFLDGGHMAILSFEKLRRRDLSIQIKERILTAGFVFLMALIGLVFALDIWRLRH